MKRYLWIGSAAFLLLLFVALYAASSYLLNFAIVRSETAHDVSPDSIVSEEDAAKINANRTLIDARRKAWLSTAEQERLTLRSQDGLELVGALFPHPAGGHKWVIGVHGYTSQKESYHNIASFYAQEGYHVLLPDMRAHGESEGRYIGMGWLDRMDLLQWIAMIVDRDPQAEIVLHGTSMGGAAVMMLSGESLPPQVKGIVEDCGYTSVWDIFTDELDYLFHLPPFPLLYTSSLLAQVQAGYSFSEASALAQVAKATVPMLFIHGSEDNFVRTDMVYELHRTCPTEKELLVVEGAGHGEAYVMNPELYFDTVFSFLRRHCTSA